MNQLQFLEDYNDIFGSPVSDAVTGFSPSFVAAPPPPAKKKKAAAPPPPTKKKAAPPPAPTNA